MNKPTNEIDIRRQKVARLRDQGINPYPNGMVVTHHVSDVLALIDKDPESAADTKACYEMAGRVTAINRFGKSAFIRFRDRTGQLQAYIRKDQMGEAAYDLFKQIDVGDFIWLAGYLFQTRTGEWTLLCGQLALSCKAVRPLPEKFHGIRDPEKRFRRRYVDLIMNEEVRTIFKRRSQIVQTIRNFMMAHEFLEVETPMMQPIAGGAEATPFKTHHNALDMALYLRIAPELYLKRLVVGGLERVFEINRNFRNEGISTRHNPEFTMLEFYQAYATYTDLMALTEQMFTSVCQALGGGKTITYQGHRIDFTLPWKRMTLTEALAQIGGIGPDLLNDREALLAIAEQRGVAVTKTNRTGKIITKLFDTLVEPQLIQPTFITGYPVEVSPLSRRSEGDPNVTDRFELFVAGYEIANGFSELNDPEDQRGRFEQQGRDREKGDEEAHQMDRDYVEALEYGMPPTAGEGIGIDRVVMLFCDVPSIREVILFPLLRPEPKAP
jgi:lysyl-tRNA synthetase class 2